MIDRVARKAKAQFFEVVGDLLAAADEDASESRAAFRSWATGAFGEATKDGALEATKDGTIVDFWAEMDRPLVKAKYAKAVASVTSGTAVVYHALKYKDVAAIRRASTFLCSAFPPADVSTNGEEVDDLVWEYLCELADAAAQFCKKQTPRVPETEELQQDIERRRATASAAKDKGQALREGAYRSVEAVCKSLSLPFDMSAAEFWDAIARVASSVELDEISAHSHAAKLAFANEFPTLFPSNATEENAKVMWSELEQAFAVRSVEQAIPVDMMKGIEEVANSIITDNVDLTKLDMHDVGQRVLQKAKRKDIEAFAKNLDKIVPAMMTAGAMGRKRGDSVVGGAQKPVS